MDAIDRLAILAELTADFCELHHGADAKKEDYKAVDVIVKEFQNKDGNVKTLYIPICELCISRSTNPDWLLVYCFECDASRWIYKPDAKNKSYNPGYNTVWLRGCPDCSGEFGGFYPDKS